ncbi:MAG: OsmC family protein [Dehalococcoidia bacterium]|jgi:putative redox protein
MIVCKSDAKKYRATISNEKDEMTYEAPAEKGGKESGFTPMEMLEAALAADMNVAIRTYADKTGFPLTDVTTYVSVDKSTTSEALIKYSVKLEGDELNSQQKKLLLQSALQTPVRSTLSKRISVIYSSRI